MLGTYVYSLSSRYLVQPQQLWYVENTSVGLISTFEHPCSKQPCHGIGFLFRV